MSPLMRCCPFVCLCDGEDWTCPDGEDTFDLVAVDVTLKHTIKGGRNTDIQITNCCLGAVDCDPPRKGITIGHDNDMDLDITYECRFVAYMAPPTGTGTDPYNLGTWTQSTLCGPYWVTAPTISGSWTSEAWTESEYPCGSGDCDSGGRRRAEFEANMGFTYTEPNGTTPPTDVLRMTKRLKIAEDYGPTPTPGGVDNPCCANRGSCLEKCIVDVLVSPENVDMEFTSLGGNQTWAYFTQSFPFTGTTPLCSVDTTPDNTDQATAPTGTAVFTTQARMVYEMDGANICDPPLEADKYAAFDSALPTAWANISSAVVAGQTITSESLVGSRLFPVSWLHRGLKIDASNAPVITLGSTGFYSATTSPPGGEACVYCVPGETEHGYCDATTSSGEFSIGTACAQYKANAANAWTDQIWEYSYDADFACGTTGIDCEPCPESGLFAYWNSGTANDKPSNQLKTVVTINSITPVHSGDC